MEHNNKKFECKALICLQDETAHEQAIVRFVGLRAKSYYYEQAPIDYASPGCWTWDFQKQKNLFKLMNSSCFGKLINNPITPKVTAKGVKKTTANKLTKKDFLSALRKQETVRKNITSIRSVGHCLRTIRQNKVVFTSLDCKRFVLPCGRYGHRENLFAKAHLVNAKYVYSFY